MKISIITPSRNQGEFITETIESVLNQDICHEYIIMDCLSDDNTLSILKSYGDKIIYKSELDNGQAHAVNKGIKISTNEIIGWINSDDIYYRGAFKSVLDYFANDINLDVLYGLAHHIDRHGKIIEIYPTKEWNDKNLLKYCYICQPTVFFRKRVFSKIGYLDESLNYCMDYEFWLRLKDNNIEVKKINRYLAGSRMYHGNKTLSKKYEVHEEICNMLKKKYGFVDFKWISNLTDLHESNNSSKLENFINFNNYYNKNVLNNLICLIKLILIKFYQKFQLLYLRLIKKNT